MNSKQLSHGTTWSRGYVRRLHYRLRNVLLDYSILYRLKDIGIGEVDIKEVERPDKL